MTEKTTDDEPTAPVSAQTGESRPAKASRFTICVAEFEGDPQQCASALDALLTGLKGRA